MTNKLFRSIGSTVLAIGCAVAMPAIAGAQTQEKPATLAGTWTLGLIGDHVIPTALVLEQKGTSLTGTFIFMGKDFPVTGDVAGTKVTLKGKGPAFGVRSGHEAGVAAGAGPRTVVAGPQAPGANPVLADMTITGDLDADGGMAGMLATKMGEGTGMIKWTAERLKERKVAESAGTIAAGTTITGSWKMTIPEAQQTLDTEFTQDGNKVTGTAKNDHLGTLVLEGTFTGGTLSLVAKGSASGQEVSMQFTGKFTKDGTFAGDAQSPMGVLAWTAERVKK